MQVFLWISHYSQNEIPEYMSKRLAQAGGAFVQAESEVSSINMVYGAAGAGGRVMTSSSSPGISLMQEGISYLAGAEAPCVIVNISRGGPGLGVYSHPNQTTFRPLEEAAMATTGFWCTARLPFRKLAIL